jgi:hypothetical protein
MEDMDIYSNPMLGSGLFGSFVSWAIGLVLIVGGFILASRFLIGKRLEQAEREWRAQQEADAEARKAAEGGGDKPEDKGPGKPEGW